MPQDKEEIIRHVNDMVARLKEGKRNPGAPRFAEIFIAGEQIQEKSEQVAEKITPPDPKEAELRGRFAAMRQLAGNLSIASDSRLQEILFYRQARLMEDFTDDCTDKAPFSMYFPSYQNMGYEQLRAYFTWRARVRQGVIEETSLSYVFVYVYELLNNIGVTSNKDGLQKLLDLWQVYGSVEKKLNRYMKEWVKEYYIVKGFSCTFQELLAEHPFLLGFYTPEEVDFFQLYAKLSDYKYEKSIFYTEEFAAILRGCFCGVIKTLTAYMEDAEAELDDLIFYGRRGSAWQPFRRALYCADCDRPKGGATEGRAVKISEAEIYWFDGSRWSCSKNRMYRESGRAIVGYIIRRIEQFYRKAAKFRHNISASKDKIDMEEVERLTADSAGFFACIDNGIQAYYRESRRISVTVDTVQLEKIRESAQRTQEKLTVIQEEEVPEPPKAQPVPPPVIIKSEPVTSIPAEDPWQGLADAFTDAERQAVRLMVTGADIAAIRDCAKAGGVMLEVLVDSMNEKAIEAVNDNICELTDTAELYEEYVDELKRVCI